MTTCSLTEAGRVTSVARAVTCALTCAVACLAGLPAVAHAALGDTAPAAEAASPPAHSVAGGEARMASYTDGAGTTVNVYIDARSRRIFAYTWQGPTAPNLDTLLGQYAAVWHSGAAALHAAGGDELHAARVETPSVIVETGGHMRGYVGRAWLPGALPVGITERTLQ